MTAPPDPAELAPTRDPRAYGRPRMMSGGFWVMMAFCGLCLAAAVFVTLLGPRLFVAKNLGTSGPPTPAAPSPWKAPLPTPAPSQVTASGDVSGLDNRLSRLEASQARALDAAAEALAATALSDAAAQPRPFAAELAAFQRVLPTSPDAIALQSLATRGAPSRAALASELADLASRASVAAKAPGKDAGFMAHIAYAVSRVVNIRRVNAVGTGPDATIAAAQTKAAEGDLEGALEHLRPLPPEALTSLQGWMDKARQRIAIDRAIAGLRAQAVSDLAAARPPRP